MNEHQQKAESQKYLATQYALVPLEPGLYGVFLAYGTHRSWQGAMTQEEFFALAERTFDHELSRSERMRQHYENMEEFRREEEAEIQSLSLDIEI